MTIVPLTRDAANALILRWHRHHKPVLGYRFAIGVEVAGQLVGAAIAGRPVARACDPARVLEVTRLVTDGTPHACSKLYGAAARIGREMGFTEIQTYTLTSEPGTSLRAAGWTDAGLSDRSSRRPWRRTDRRQLRLDTLDDPLAGRRDQPVGRKRRWTKQLTKGAA